MAYGALAVAGGATANGMSGKGCGMVKKTSQGGTPGGSKSKGSISGGQRQLRTNVKTAHKRSASSARWLDRQLNDPYVAASKRDGFRSRAAYKLKEIDERFHILKSGQRVIDLGAAPGGWSQIAADRVKSLEGKGQVVAIDYLGVDPIPGVEIFELDFTHETTEDKLKASLRDGHADVVLSDMAAPTIGHAKTDHIRIMGLAETAAAFAVDVLAPGGAFLCKVLQGGAERDLLDILRRNFATVKHVKPPASRADSAELYVLATGFRGRVQL
jgi:23S rRNA (uridine2552-2'-O)-methyltransferase